MQTSKNILVLLIFVVVYLFFSIKKQTVNSFSWTFEENVYSILIATVISIIFLQKQNGK